MQSSENQFSSIYNDIDLKETRTQDGEMNKLVSRLQHLMSTPDSQQKEEKLSNNNNSSGSTSSTVGTTTPRGTLSDDSDTEEQLTRKLTSTKASPAKPEHQQTFSKEEPSENTLHSKNFKDGYVVCMRGLPFQVTEKEIYDFFEGLSCLDVRIVHNSSGDAYAVFETENDRKAAIKKSNEHIGKRYVVIWRSSLEEMRNCSYQTRARQHRCPEITPRLMAGMEKSAVESYEGFFEFMAIIRDFPSKIPIPTKFLLFETLLSVLRSAFARIESPSYSNEFVPSPHDLSRLLETALSRESFSAAQTVQLQNMHQYSQSLLRASEMAKYHMGMAHPLYPPNSVYYQPPAAAKNMAPNAYPPPPSSALLPNPHTQTAPPQSQHAQMPLLNGNQYTGLDEIIRKKEEEIQLLQTLSHELLQFQQGQQSKAPQPAPQPTPTRGGYFPQRPVFGPPEALFSTTMDGTRYVSEQGLQSSPGFLAPQPYMLQGGPVQPSSAYPPEMGVGVGAGTGRSGDQRLAPGSVGISHHGSGHAHSYSSQRSTPDDVYAPPPPASGRPMPQPLLFQPMMVPSTATTAHQYDYDYSTAEPDAASHMPAPLTLGSYPQNTLPPGQGSLTGSMGLGLGFHLPHQLWDSLTPEEVMHYPL
eukprot:GCRY01001645.1.p1 GENE.GCRY01001645.1~~GCRY01001645.1.p1  ORF type:complete len:640 (-),score=134.61 GCRY01001645.1:244-2163(-)